MTKAGTCPHCGAGLVDGAALCEVCGGVARDSGTIPIVRDAALSSTDPVLDRASLEPRPMGSSGAGGQSLAFDSMDYIATALDSEEENEEEILATGMWHILVSEEEEEGTFATPFDQAPVDLPPGIRVRRVEGQVEVEVLDDAKLVTLDGQPVEGLFRANLALQMVVVDSEPLLDSMVPQDVLTQDDLPEFFAPIVIGRDSVCDVVLDSRAVSGQHLSLSRREGHLLLEDLDSINGTFVENRRIKRARIGWRQPFRVADQVMTAVDVVLQVRTRRAAASTSIVSALSPEALGVDHAPAQLGPTSDLGPGSSFPPVRSAVVPLDSQWARPWSWGGT